MLSALKLRDEMLGLYEVLEDDRILNWVKSLKDTSNFVSVIENVRKELLEGVETKDPFSRDILYKWERDVGNLLNLPGLWTNGAYKSWRNLNIDGHIVYGADVVYDCDESLKGKMYIPDSITSINERAFKGCNLEEIILPNNLKYIGYMAFADCRSLKSVRIPPNVEDMGTYVFEDSLSLEHLEIPFKLIDMIEKKAILRGIKPTIGYY